MHFLILIPLERFDAAYKRIICVFICVHRQLAMLTHLQHYALHSLMMPRDFFHRGMKTSMRSTRFLPFFLYLRGVTRYLFIEI